MAERVSSDHLMLTIGIYCNDRRQPKTDICGRVDLTCQDKMSSLSDRLLITLSSSPYGNLKACMDSLVGQEKVCQ